MATSREHYQKLIKTLRDRLEVLDLQRAEYGLATPPHITTQIEDIGLEIRVIEASITALDTVVDLAINSGDRTIDRRDQANYEQRQHIMIATVQATVAELGSVRKAVRDDIVEIKEDMRAFQTMVAESLNRFHNDAAGSLRMMWRVIIGIGVFVVVGAVVWALAR